MQNLSYENEFYLYENEFTDLKNVFSSQWFCLKTHFDTAPKGKLKMAYFKEKDRFSYHDLLLIRNELQVIQ